MSKLIIVESPGKINTISKYAKGFTVKASIGHIKDLPKKKLGIDVKKDFATTYVINEDKEDVVADLKKAAKNADEIYLATDPDREGEAIAQHLAEELNVTGKCRITFNEITKNAIQEALKNPRTINSDKVNAQNTRRILDRLVGYSISPLLWYKVAPGTSAGRVQSAALQLISQKEREIRRFKSEDYWTIEAQLEVDKKTITVEVVDESGKQKEFTSEKEADESLEELKKNKIEFIATDVKNTSRSPYPPFTTSTLQQACAAALGMSAHQTMSHAQKLYEGIAVPGQDQTALITYMRTDSTRSSPEAITSARDHIKTHFASEYLPNTFRSYAEKKGKHQQDAHEAVRPTHIEIEPSCLRDSDQKRVYDLVWRRFVASQMNDAKIEQTRLKFKAGKIRLEAKGSRIVFDGFLAVYKIGIEEQELPKIDKAKDISLNMAEGKKHSTQPPKRYSEAQLIKTLEKEGIGRPSTYASTIKTIIDRGYVKKEKGSFFLTEIGLLVNDELQRSFPNIINLKFTSKMEEDLDKIEDGESWKEIVSKFYDELKNSLKDAKKVAKTNIRTTSECPQCKKNMIIKFGKNGRFMACEAYPECKQSQDLGPDLDILNYIDCYTDKGVDVPKQGIITDPCPKCGSQVRRRFSKFGAFFGCSAYPECKYIKNIDVEIIKCPECETGKIVEKGKQGKKFYACNAYPDCKKIYSHKPVEDKCEKCQNHMVSYKKRNVCVNKDCDKFVQTGTKWTKRKN